MPQLALLLAFLLAPLANEVSIGVLPVDFAPASGVDPCAVAEQIAAQPPCLRPEDCGALEDWKRLFGDPRTELLHPQLAEGGVSRSSALFRPDPRLRKVPTSYVCLAAASSEDSPYSKPRMPMRSPRD